MGVMVGPSPHILSDLLQLAVPTRDMSNHFNNNSLYRTTSENQASLIDFI